MFPADFPGPVLIHSSCYVSGGSRSVPVGVTRYFVVFVRFSLDFGVLYSAELSHIALIDFVLAALHKYINTGQQRLRSYNIPNFCCQVNQLIRYSIMVEEGFDPRGVECDSMPSSSCRKPSVELLDFRHFLYSLPRCQSGQSPY